MNRLLLAASACTAVVALAATGSGYRSFAQPQPVTIAGYDGDAMEPFITRDGRYLLFNNSNDPRVDTNLHWAERVDDLHFRYLGLIPQVNSPSLDGVPTASADGTLYFVSTRSYEKTLATVYTTSLSDSASAGVALVEGVSPRIPGIVNFDVEVTADGTELLLVDGRFEAGKPLPQAADFVVAHRRDGAFVRDPASVEVFARVNTGALEYAAALSADHCELFFTRADPAAGVAPRIYRAERASAAAPFGDPQLVVAADGFVEAPAFDADGSALYFHRQLGQHFAIWRMAR